MQSRYPWNQSGTTSRRVGLDKPTQKWWSLQDDTHLTQVHGTEKAVNLQPLRTATTDSWTSAAQSSQSHGLLPAWYSFTNWKMKKPLTGYRAGARHRKSYVSNAELSTLVAKEPDLLSRHWELCFVVSCFRRVNFRCLNTLPIRCLRCAMNEPGTLNSAGTNFIDCVVCHIMSAVRNLIFIVF